MTQQVLNICKSAYIQLRQISSISHFLTSQTNKSLVRALIISRLDYDNCLLAGCPRYLIFRMQKIQNATAQLIVKVKKFDYIKPILQSLHWLPIRARIQYKACKTCLNAITGSGPQYISELLHLHTPSTELSSADTRLLKIPRSGSEVFGERSLLHSPSSWNDLLYNLCHCDSNTSFIYQQALKTHLFQQRF